MALSLLKKMILKWFGSNSFEHAAALATAPEGGRRPEPLFTVYPRLSESATPDEAGEKLLFE